MEYQTGVSKKERRKRAAEALTRVGLKDHMNKRPNQLSGGQMQRVAIARALVNNPEIILADEPTGALDSETSIQIMDILKEVAKEKLVIMVTHNPELARKYSTRIIELKDGLILNDSNPYSYEENNINTKKVNKTSMSLWTSLGLSFNNLLTKKGRTILTAFAGSIGIVGISLILSLSNGVSNYVSTLERDSLSNYPISLEENSYDFSKLIGTTQTETTTAEDDKLYSKDDITSTLDLLANDIIKKNNLEEFKNYLDENNEIKDYTSEIKYGYNLDLQIYSNKNYDYTKINPEGFNIFKNSSSSKEEGAMSLPTANQTTPVFQELLDNEELLNTKYDVIAGSLPKDYNELVLVVGKDNVIPDSILYALDIKGRKELTSLLNKINNKEKVNVDSTAYSYDDILNLSYKLVLNTDYYKYENGVYKDYSNNIEHMNKIVDNGLDIKIVGILRAKDDAVTSNVIGYKHSLTEYVISNISKTDLYKEQINNQDINVLTGEEFDNVTSTYESNCKLLGIANLNNPSSINIYPKNFDSKEKVISLTDNYNNSKKKIIEMI
ncbi:ATP-binding cassette domain-containing protein [uncultured Clostridium sp.]|uniref:ABC transporter ATP-binding protein n=1 Tax=uncultured Clostridium sp. TaxID=59620 RepID=UPI00342FC251